MIKRIIKRDGTTEPFQPSKVNGWGEWAAQTLGEDLVDWSSIVAHAVSKLPEECSSQDLQDQLIKECLDMDTWSYYRMAGRLFAAYLRKKIFDDNIPSVKKLHKELVTLGFMRPLDYNPMEYAHIEAMIDHDRDFDSAHFELKQVREKYSLKNRLTGDEYETQQFVYMRMAMALAEDQPAHRRLDDVEAWYNYFSKKIINAPTPNYVNLGTPHRGYASCCVYTTNDTWPSLAIADHIAYVMTCMSAGIGGHINTRSIGDPVRGGLIRHQGKLHYYRASVAAVKANLQNGRGGAQTMHFPIFDPEINELSQLKNPLQTEDKKIRGMDYSMTGNKLFARKAAKNEKMFLFNCFTAPDLYDAFYSGDEVLFEELYLKYENDDNFKKTWVDTREILLTSINEAYETGRSYLTWADEMNRHTPFLDKIYSSNLCQEVMLPTKGYEDMRDLYSEEDHGRGEVAMCSLGGILVGNVESDEQYEDAMYYALLMVDKCIHQAHYALPHIGVTAKARLSAGIGIVGLAHYMAKRGLKYSSQEGKDEIHRLNEKHMYYAIRGSLRLSKELGLAPWMHKTKWPSGWLPIDTYNRNVDNVVNCDYQFDWEELRQEIVENGGIRNSVLVAHMPAESSSKASGTCNGIYPVRDLTLNKTDNEIHIWWAAPDGDTLGDQYEIAWDIPTKDMIDVYAITQKWTDQGVSADLYRRIVGADKVGAKEMLGDYFYMTKMGLKSRYYQNSKTSKGGYLDGEKGEPVEETEIVQQAACEGGSCSL